MKINFNRRIPRITEEAKMYTDEHVLPKFMAAAQESFGPDFNLIRAVREYGPSRVEGIKKELDSIEDRKQRLTEEMNILTKLIAATE
jgi:hypothetical protein